jgi:hypothetical protein
LIGLVDWFLVSKWKFLVRLALTKVCILTLSSYFCRMSLMAFSNKRWSFSTFYRLAKLLFLRGSFSLNTTFLGIKLWVVIVNTMLIATSFLLGVAIATFSLNMAWAMSLWG